MHVEPAPHATPKLPAPWQISGRAAVATVSLAIIWGGTWAVVLTGFALYHILVGVVSVPAVHPYQWHRLAIMAVAYFAAGFVVGGLFALLLRAAERRQVVGTLSPMRVALWGALAATMLSMLLIYFVASVGELPKIPALVMWALWATIVGKAAILGAICGLATLALARRRRTAQARPAESR